MAIIPMKLLAVIAIVLIAGCASPQAGEAKDVRITLSDYKITSSLTEFEKGTAYRLIISNAGRDTHELTIMPRGETDLSMALFRTGDIRPEGRVEKTFVFPASGELELACHLSQHYGAGMVKLITVK